MPGNVCDDTWVRPYGIGFGTYSQVLPTISRLKGQTNLDLQPTLGPI
jgi:hypothetical protein